MGLELLNIPLDNDDEYNQAIAEGWHPLRFSASGILCYKKDTDEYVEIKSYTFYPIGAKIDFLGTKCIVEEGKGNTCIGCIFEKDQGCYDDIWCTAREREDNTSIIFKPCLNLNSLDYTKMLNLICLNHII